MKLKALITMTGLLSAGLPLHAQTVLQNEHVDIGIAYEDGASHPAPLPSDRSAD